VCVCVLLASGQNLLYSLSPFKAPKGAMCWKIDTNQLTFVPFISMSVGGFLVYAFEFIARLTAFTSQILTLTTFCA